jgi:tetratricopeptide (TPR) repeat protein
MASDPTTETFWETAMRFTPAAILLVTSLALTASSSLGQKGTPAGAKMVAQMASPKAAAWVEQGAQALAAGDLDEARTAYETALLLSPGDASLYFALGKIARAEKRPGAAIKFFADSRRLDPQNQAALQQEGLAMMDKGAIESARQTLAELKTMCQTSCAIAEPLTAAIAAGPPKIQTADASAAAKPSPIEKD